MNPLPRTVTSEAVDGSRNLRELTGALIDGRFGAHRPQLSDGAGVGLRRNQAEIAETFGLSLSWTGEVLRSYVDDMPVTGRGYTCDIDKAVVQRQYEQGGTIREIADAHDVSYGTIRRLLKRAGVPMRPRGVRPR